MNKDAVPRPDPVGDPGRVSITITVMVIVGLLIAVTGIVMLIAGLGGSSAFEASLGDVKLKTESVGLAVLVVGLVFAGFAARTVSEGGQLLGEAGVTPAARLRAAGRPLLAAAAVALVVFLVVLLFT